MWQIINMHLFGSPLMQKSINSSEYSAKGDRAIFPWWQQLSFSLLNLSAWQFWHWKDMAPLWKGAQSGRLLQPHISWQVQNYILHPHSLCCIHRSVIFLCISFDSPVFSWRVSSGILVHQHQISNRSPFMMTESECGKWLGEFGEAGSVDDPPFLQTKK